MFLKRNTVQEYSDFFTTFFHDLVVDAALFRESGEAILAQDHSWKGKHWENLIPEGVHDSFQYAFDWCLEVHQVRSVQAPIVEGNRIKWVQYRLGYYENNDFTGVSLISIDITHQVDTLNELEKLSRSIEQTPSLIVMTDLNGRTEYINPSYERIYGVNLSEQVGKIPIQLKQDKNKDYTQIWKTLSMGESWTGEIEVTRPNGSTGQERLKAFCIQNELGEITQFCLIIEDISREYMLQNQLAQSQRLEAIGTLAGGVAHDFNNILMIISGFSEIGLRSLTEELKDHKANNAFQTILEATARASQMTNSLLSFSRRQDLNTEKFDVGSFVQELVPLWERLIPQNITIQYIRSEKKVEIEADRVHLEQILMNLVVNAKDAIEDANRDQGLIILKLESAKEIATIRLIDNGIGIPDEIKEKIFDPFYTTKEKDRGTGLGLSTVIGLVKQHKGDLKVVSDKENGTEFIIHIPLVREDNTQEKLPNKKSILPQGDGRALVVDDESSIREFFADILMELGYEVIEAENGRKAQELCDSKKFDIIFSDLNMPIMNGVDFLNCIRGHQAHIIVISGFKNQFEEIPPDITSSFSSIQFMKKPVSVHSLVRAIKQLQPT